MRLIFKMIVWFQTLLFLVLFFILDKNSNTSLNIHDTYYVISKADLYFLFFVLFLLYGIVGFFNKNNCFSLFIITLTLTTILVWCLILVDYLDKKPISEVDFQSLVNQPNYNFYLLIILFILIITQILFFINTFALLVTKIRRPKS